MSATFPVAPPKPAMPEAAQGRGHFAALVDNSLPQTPSTQPSPASDPTATPAPQLGSHAGAQSSDDPARDGGPSTTDKQGAGQDDSSASSTQPAYTGRSSAPQANSTKDAASISNADKSSSDETPSAEKDAASDQTASGEAAATTASMAVATTANIVIIAPPPPVHAAPVIAGNSAPPLAIAAAALAASASPTAGLSGSLPQVAAPGPAASAPAAAGIPANSGSGAHAAAELAGQVNKPAAPPEPQLPIGPAVSTAPASVGTVTAPAAGKIAVAGFQTPSVAKPKASDATQSADLSTGDGSTVSTTVSAARDNLTQQQLVTDNGEQVVARGEPATLNSAKDDPSPAAAAAFGAHDRTAAAQGVPTPTGPADSTMQPAAAINQPPPAPLPPTISTATLTAAPMTGAAVPLGAIPVEIAASVQSGKTRFELRLDPADLGRVDVRIDVDRSGQVISHLTVEKPETLAILRQDAPQLQQALNDAGLKTGSGGLQFSLRDQSGSGQNNGNQPNPNTQQLVVGEEDAVTAALAGRSYARMLGVSGGVDITV